MKKFVAILTAMVMCLMGISVLAEEPASTVIRGEIVDGDYVVKFPVREGDTGIWQAGESAQENALVSTADAYMEDGMYVVRFAAAGGGDGEETVLVRHMNGFVCDELHGFTLEVKDGRIAECMGGSYTASPEVWELDPVLVGEWLEKDTEFTVMDMEHMFEGWEMTIVSPVSHGAYMLKAEVRYDCEKEALVYENGSLYDLPFTDETAEPVPAHSGLTGRVDFGGTEEQIELTWTAGDSEDAQKIVFTRAEALPGYVYAGSDPVEKAISDYMIDSGTGDLYLQETGSVVIPEPVIVKVETLDDAHVRVYGNFWCDVYARRGTTLKCTAGGEAPSVAELEKDGEAWKVVSVETASDGTEYDADIRKFCNGDRELEKAYSMAGNVDSDLVKDVRIRTIRAYVEANGLFFTAYQDYGCEPVSLGDE